MRKIKGKRLGRPPVNMSDEFEVACELCIKGIRSTREAADTLSLSHSIFYRHYKKYKEKLVLESRR